MVKGIAVIPTYNERENVGDIIKGIRRILNDSIDILIVDSASPDGTADCVREIQKQDAHLFLLEQNAKLGLGKAYLDGMAWVLAKDYDCLVTMDADFSHKPRYLKYHLEEIEKHDLVIGSRYVKGGALRNWPWARRVLSRFANGYARTLTGLPFSDLTSGFQCYRTALLKKILESPIETEGYAFLIELKSAAILNGARFKEIPIIFSDRTKGDSKITKKVMLESMLFVMKQALKRGQVVKATAKIKKEQINEISV